MSDNSNTTAPETVEMVGGAENPNAVVNEDIVYQEEPHRISKIITVIVGENDDKQVEISKEHFEGLDEHKTAHIIAELLRKASLTLLQESTTFKDNPELAEATVSANPGSLYDNILFEVGVYLTDQQGVVVNPSFGRLMDETALLEPAVRMMSDTILSIANEIHAPHDVDGNIVDPNTGEVIQRSDENNKPAVENTLNEAPEAVKDRF